MAKLQYLVIHCTATPEGKAVSSADIRRWHTSPPPSGRGWMQVGYTDMIHLDGRIERLVRNNDDDTVDTWEITNGVAGKNAICRHIVYVGGMNAANTKAEDTRTPQQLAAMESFVKSFHLKYPRVRIVGHNAFAAKACPSFDVPTWLRLIGL